MQKGIIGKKVGMTQVFDEKGNVVPVTVIEAGPCVVVQKKTAETDGYAAVQLGFGDPSLITGVDGLLYAKDSGDLGLCFIMILPQPSDDERGLHNVTTLLNYFMAVSVS